MIEARGRMLRLAAACFGLHASLAVAAQPVLTTEVGGRATAYAPSELLARPDVVTVTIPEDVAYQRSMSYRALPMVALLAGVAPSATLRFAASDGFATSLPAALLLATDEHGARAYLAIEPEDAQWPSLRADEPASAGPFYLVWTHPERGRVVPEQWPYRISRIEEMAPLAARFPVIVPAAGVPAGGPVNRGFTVFTQNCIVCHTLNLAGDASIGPDLNVPYNPTEYLSADALRRVIRDPQSLRRWPGSRMPGFDVGVLSDRELNDVLAYLRYMASRKVPVPDVAK